MSLTRSLITDQHRLILGQPPANRFATGTAPFKRHVSIDKETGNAVGDALSVANHWEIAQKGSQESAFVTLGYVGSRLVYEIAVYEFKIGREKPLIIAVRSRRGLFSALSGICQ